jgi:alkanesulfonate monooxygenase SsuD/methylene tetrahydromethanopterin reductase-like flavin-dependent oxidoreductase (luciferase family)
MPEESRFTGTDFHTRGKRANEMIEILQLVCAGNGPEFVEYHGQFYDFDPLMISPAPTHRVKIHVGGLSEPAYRRAARLADGWISVQNTEAEIRKAIDRLTHYRNEHGRADRDFAINVLPIDVFDIDGYKRLENAGVTELQVLPWYFDPRGGDPEALSTRVDSLAWFADEVIAKY